MNLTWVVVLWLVEVDFSASKCTGTFDELDSGIPHEDASKTTILNGTALVYELAKVRALFLPHSQSWMD